MTGWVDKSYEQEFLQCRALGHRWEDFSRYSKVSPGTVGRVLTCESCGMERLDILDKYTYELVARKYLSPRGYAKPEDAETLRRVAFTKEAFKRASTQPAPEALVVMAKNSRKMRAEG